MAVVQVATRRSALLSVCHCSILRLIVLGSDPGPEALPSGSVALGVSTLPETSIPLSLSSVTSEAAQGCVAVTGAACSFCPWATVGQGGGLPFWATKLALEEHRLESGDISF